MGPSSASLPNQSPSAPSASRQIDPVRRVELPSWLLSLLLHLVILLALGWLVQMTPRRGASGERTAEVGIALKRIEGTAEYYEHGPSSDQASGRQHGPATAARSVQEVLADTPAPDPSAALPAPLPVIGPTASTAGGPLQLGPSTGQGIGPGAELGGKARVRVFGLEGQGRKFVFVFDRSESMSWHQQRPLRACKAELLAAIESLQSTHQFQIIFYNQEPLLFNPAGKPGRLAFATEQNKRRARSFIQSVTATGGTRHLQALLLALSLHPDVIFFLTDADEPEMTDAELAEVRRRAGGTVIYAVEFGFGPQRRTDNFLVKLARQNGGQHTYVDISRLPD